ncbi:MAG: PHP domain-containing protein [Clostridia bacterium]|nr:PHP domain-containing protein [Clostridia bacterium]
MRYKYETHLHTMQGSACGKVPGRAYIAKYMDLGYDGIFVTDHFFHGNCRPSRDLPWPEWVTQYCRGYEDAAEEGYKRGFKVFFGLEARFDLWDEWLVYGLTKEYMLDHPDMRDWTRRQYLDHVHAAGGCCIQCHPFRQAGYMGHVAPCLGVDGVEVCNSGNRPEWDAMAARYAQKMLPHAFRSAGSDIHHTDDRQGDQVFGVSFDRPLNSALDYARAVRENAPHDLLVPPGRDLPMDRDVALDLPMTVLDRDGLSTGLGIRDIF